MVNEKSEAKECQVVTVKVKSDNSGPDMGALDPALGISSAGMVNIIRVAEEEKLDAGAAKISAELKEVEGQIEKGVEAIHKLIRDLADADARAEATPIVKALSDLGLGTMKYTVNSPRVDAKYLIYDMHFSNQHSSSRLDKRVKIKAPPTLLDQLKEQDQRAKQRNLLMERLLEVKKAKSELPRMERKIMAELDRNKLTGTLKGTQLLNKLQAAVNVTGALKFLE